LETQWVIPSTIAYLKRLRPKWVPFSGFRYMRVSISLVEEYERVGKSVISICKKAQKG